MGNCVSTSDFANDSVGQQCAANNDVHELASFAVPNQNSLCSKASLIFSCTNLLKCDRTSDSDAFIVVYESRNGQYIEVGRTEVIVDTNNPKFVKHIPIIYKFEIIQNLKFQVFDADVVASDTSKLVLSEQDFLGEAQCTLAEIVNAVDKKTINLTGLKKNQGSITIQYEEIKESQGKIPFTLSLTNINSSFIRGTCNPFFTISKSSNDRDILIYKSEVHHNTNTCAFAMVSFDSYTLCNNDYNSPLLIELYSWVKGGKHRLLGKTIFVVNDLFVKDNVFAIKNSNSQEVASISVKKTALQEIPSFLSCIQNGMELNFMVAIDFTGSNGDPRDPGSLHYVNLNNPKYTNSYENAIMAVGNVLEYYDKDKMFPVYGFGGIPPNISMQNAYGNSGVSHCFPLNGNPNQPEVYGIKGILDLYRQTILRVGLSGPTYFEYIMQQAANYAYECQQSVNKYMILLLLTDGCIHDMEKTIRTIVNASMMPLSIIIVGVGHADFSSMEILDGDTERLHYNNITAKRDIVQFLPLEELKDNTPLNVAKELLQEIPSQVTSYLECNHISLAQIKKAANQAQAINASIPVAAPVNNTSIPVAAPVAAPVAPIAAPVVSDPYSNTPATNNNVHFY